MIPRQTPLKRSAKPIKRTAIRARKPKAASRRGPACLTVDEWRNPAYRAYLRENGYCAACMKIAAMIAFGRRIDPAHGPVNGMRQKGPDCECIPLCRHHHQEQHRIGWAAFEVKYGFSRAAQAKLWWQSFQRHESQTKSKA